MACIYAIDAHEIDSAVGFSDLPYALYACYRFSWLEEVYSVYADDRLAQYD